MKTEAKYLLVVAVIFIGLVVWRLQDKPISVGFPESEQSTKSQDDHAGHDHSGHSHDHSQVNDSPIMKRPKETPLPAEKVKSLNASIDFRIPKNLSESERERRAMDAYAKAFYVFSHNEQKPETLVKKLAEAGLKPLVVQDFNDVTGKMIVIRTNETLPGTRYFHAQYFEDENKQAFLQHMSVEFKPAEDSLDKAVAALQAQYPGSTPRKCSDDFIAWESGARTVWCNQFRTKEDLEVDEPNRAYSYPEDINTTRCAVEINPHPQDDLCGH
jgi:hypothetical protein